jgi:hypothetical protein
MENFNEFYESAVSKHLAKIPSSLLQYMKDDYADDHMVVFDKLLPEDIRNSMESEANLLLEKEAQRRDVIIAQSGDTPRAYNSVGRNIIRSNGRHIPAFFDSPSITAFLSAVVGEPVYGVPYEPEEFIINSQSRTGDTHGWHWDAYTFALIWIVDEPDVLKGGRVEFVPKTPWKKTDTKDWMQEILSTKAISSYHISKGQCYLLRAGETLHRISPLTGETKRTVIVFTYATEKDLTDANISHESMEAIYPSDTKSLVEV